jgi:subtilisin-like proprotein convertase family protein
VKLAQNSCSIIQQNAQAKMEAITMAVALTHQRFGAIVLAFNKPIRKASREKLEKGQNFLSPIHKG